MKMFTEQINQLKMRKEDLEHEITSKENEIKDDRAKLAIVKRTIKSLERSQALLDGDTVEEADIPVQPFTDEI